MRLLQRVKLLGIVFLAMLMGGVYLTYAIFSKQFVAYDEVKLETSNIGLQLPADADVKMRGVIVGQVRDLQATASGATITLGLYPSEIDAVPADVTGSIVPKTLFGEKYVSLVAANGTQPPAKHIVAGDVIKRTKVATEVEEVLGNLYPLLRTVQPGDINMTLNAISTALEGRGNAIGENLVVIDNYLKKMNPLVPKLLDDLRKTATVSEIYSEVLPKIGTTLRNTVTTTTTLQDRDQAVRALYTNVASFADSTRTFLEDNGDNLIRLAKVSVPQLDVLAKYSGEFPCLLRGVVNADKRQAEAFRGFTLHIILETLPNQPRAYTAADQPVYGEDRGPNCVQLPNPPGSQERPTQITPNFSDGVDTPTGKGTDRVAPHYYHANYVGTPEETKLVNTLVAPTMGMSTDDVPDLGGLLLGPIMRGAKVTLR